MAKKYELVDTKDNNYQIINAESFSNFDAEQEFLSIWDTYFSNIKINHLVASQRKGDGKRKEVLLKINFAEFTSNYFFVYCHPTEDGGRGDGGRFDGEARIQWRPHGMWNPDLNSIKPAINFNNSLQEDLTNKECYIFGFYKRNGTDSDVIISAVYPSYADTVETTSTSPKSIQYRYSDIQQAYINGISITNKGTNKPSIIHFKPQYLIWYMIHRDKLHYKTLLDIQQLLKSEEDKKASRAVVTNPLPANIPHNKIVYGAPGTGKSYKLNEEAKRYFSEYDTIRVTFHPNYSYQQFLGTYKPAPIYRENGTDEADYYGSDHRPLGNKKEPLIDYTFIPGPFLKLFVEAIKHSENNYLLLIEEINRASVGAVFGDIFQLLDRDSNGDSEYEIEFNADITNYISKLNLGIDKIKLPSNLYIWATMNSADQGVMPLDAAFKRRWAFEYLPLNENESEIQTWKVKFQGRELSWNDLRTKINKALQSLNIPEDKLIGPFFMKESELSDENAIKNKLLIYLRDDVVRHNPGQLFMKTSFSEIVDDYNNNKPIFSDIINLYTPEKTDLQGDVE